MGIQAGVGGSTKPDAFDAGYTACSEALLDAGISKPDLTIVFASSIYDQEAVVRGVRKANNNSPLIGCSSAGEITGEGPTRQSVAVMVIESDTLACTTGVRTNIGEDAHEAGFTLAEALRKGSSKPFSAFMMFPDILVGNGAAVLRGAQKALGDSMPIVGGAAGDDFGFEKTFQYHNDEVTTGGVAGIGFSGTFVMGAGVRHGWVPIGLPLRVTKSSGSVLYELEGSPAVKIYEDYFGEDVARLRDEPLARLAITYPLGIKMRETDEYLIRDPIRVNPDGSLTCAAEIPEGAEVRLMIGSHENAVEAAQAAARKLMHDFEEAKAKPRLLFIFNCIARERLMGRRAGEEIRAVADIVGRDIPTIGFYTYGEIAPTNGEIRAVKRIFSRFYNETIVLFAIGA